MARLPKAVRDAFAKSENRSRGIATWRRTQTAQRRGEFDVTIKTYLKGRGDGTISLSYTKFADVVKKEFDFPFEWNSLRSYMEKTYPDLFKAQVVDR